MRRALRAPLGVAALLSLLHLPAGEYFVTQSLVVPPNLDVKPQIVAGPAVQENF